MLKYKIASYRKENAMQINETTYGFKVKTKTVIEEINSF